MSRWRAPPPYPELMHRVGIPRQSSGGYPAFGLKNPVPPAEIIRCTSRSDTVARFSRTACASIPLAPLIPGTKAIHTFFFLRDTIRVQDNEAWCRLLA